MTAELKELIREAKSKSADCDLWDYSLRAKEYAEWLEQIYNELISLRKKEINE